MKIVNQNPSKQKVAFSTVFYGDTFRYSDSEYLKINGGSYIVHTHNPNDGYAVNLRDNKVYFFPFQSSVEPIEAEVHIK